MSQLDNPQDLSEALNGKTITINGDTQNLQDNPNFDVQSGDKYRTISTTSQTIVSTGNLTFTVDSGLSYTALQDVSIVYDISNYMSGHVVSYSGTTLVVNIQHKTGSGTYSLWTINLDGVPVDAISGGGTAEEIAYFTASKVLASLPTATYPSLIELARLKGVTGPVQTQIDTKIDGSLTPTRIPFSSAPKTLSDKNGFDFISATNTLNNFLTETQRITNGNFTGNATGWTLGSGWAYNSNAVYKTANGTRALTQGPTIYNGGYYRLTYTILPPQTGSYVGTITPNCGGVTLTTRSATGTYTEYVLAINNAGISFTPSNTARLGIDSVSLVELTNGDVRAGNVYSNEITVSGNKSNFTPGTSRHISLKNQGSYSWIDSYFGNTLGGAIGFQVGGHINYIAPGGGQHVFQNGTLNSFYITQSAALHLLGYFGSQMMHAGGVSQPRTTLQVSGSAGYSWTYISTETTLTNSTPLYVMTNADEGATCGGSATTPCNAYTTQSDCLARNSHGGCNWATSFACQGSNAVFSSCGGDNSAFMSCSGDNSSPNTCPSITDPTECNMSGCSYDFDNSTCTGDNSTSNTCPSQSDATSCTNAGCNPEYSPNTCPDQTDASSCSGAGCTPNYTENTCPTYSDYESCLSAGCTPGEVGACSGTPTCSSVSIGECTSEPGCSLIGGISITMPNDNLYGTTSYFQTFFIKNNGTTYNTTLRANPSSSGQTINKTSSVVLGPGESGHFAFHYITRSCSSWNGDPTTCAVRSGCSYQSCSGLNETDCNNAGGQCSWDSMSFTCVGTGNCTGTNIVMKDWVSYPCTF